MTSLIRFGRWSWSWCIAIAIVALGAAFLRPAPHREGTPLTKYMVRMPAIAARNNVAILASSPAGTAATPPPAERAALERAAAIALFVPDVEPAISVLRALARARGGEIVALKDERPDVAGRPQSADVSLAVPAAEMDAALARIAALGGVRSRSETALDAGADIVDDAARLRNLRRTEADIRKIMDRSGKIGDVLEVENQLSTVRDEIERLAGAYAAVQRRVAFATIDVSLGERCAGTSRR